MRIDSNTKLPYNKGMQGKFFIFLKILPGFIWIQTVICASENFILYNTYYQKKKKITEELVLPADVYSRRNQKIFEKFENIFFIKSKTMLVLNPGATGDYITYGEKTIKDPFSLFSSAGGQYSFIWHNRNSDSREIIFICDDLPPELIVMVQPPPEKSDFLGPYNSIELTAYDNGSGVEKILCSNQSKSFAYNGPLPAAIFSGGAYLAVTAVDRLGNMQPSNIFFPVDMTAPKISISTENALPAGNIIYLKKEGTISISAVDAESGLENIFYSINSSAFNVCGALLSNIPDGLLHYYAADQAGNKTEIFSRAIKNVPELFFEIK